MGDVEMKTMVTETQIEDALTSGAGTHQGAVVTTGVSPSIRSALLLAGLIGAEGGLTRAGSILAGRLRDAALDRAFG